MKESKEVSKPKILMIGTDWSQNEYRKDNNAPGAISTYRLIYPKRYLDQFYDVTYLGSDFGDGSEGVDTAEFYHERLKDYDLVISKVTDNPQAGAAIRFMTQHLGIPLVVDIDDNIWEIKSDQPAYKVYYKGSDALGAASAFVGLADAVFCSTKPLADYITKRMRKIHKEKTATFVLPNCIDPDDFKFDKAALDPNKIVIGWQGSTTHHEDLKVAMPAVIQIMQEYPNVYLELLGGVTDEMVADLFKDVDESILDRVRTKSGVPAWDQFPKLLSEQAWDIAIAPLTDDEFNRAKSHIKWMEYSMYAIPTIASKVYPYFESIQGRSTIQDGLCGFIAEPTEWYEKIKYLIEIPAARYTNATMAKQFVSESWSIHAHGAKWKEAIDSLLDTES